MKNFKSSNNIDMVEAKLFNWRIQPYYYGQDEPFGYCIDMGSISEMYTALYMPDKKQLSLFSVAYSSNESFKFHCEDIYAAELIVDAFIKGNEFDMSLTIFKKIENNG